ncbi:MAG: hypothetical protein JKY31_12455 [Rhodobacteraceae bacterium]|nr:hypothetical protein [Paracoccaceae bacterium]
MRDAIAIIRSAPNFRPAIIAPIAIMLIFSFFNLSAAPDQARITSAITLGVVNHDTGMTFPPIKVSNRIMEGMAESLPFAIADFDDDGAARIALEAGDVTAVLIFPADFSKNAASGEQIEITVLNTQHLSIMESQMGAQLPMLLQSAMSAAVGMVRVALSEGRLPSGEFPVVANVQTLHVAGSGVALAAPFVMGFATWLAAMVGAMMLFFATREADNAKARAIVRTALPVIITMVATLVLALVVCGTTGQWDAFLCLWLSAWPVLLVLSWLFAGLFAVFNVVAMLIILPVVFYQTAVGGAQAPVAAAPSWLRGIAEAIPFDAVAGIYRGVLIGGNGPFPIMLTLITATIGLVMIWAGSMAFGGSKAE